MTEALARVIEDTRPLSELNPGIFGERKPYKMSRRERFYWRLTKKTEPIRRWVARRLYNFECWERDEW